MSSRHASCLGGGLLALVVTVGCAGTPAMRPSARPHPRLAGADAVASPPAAERAVGTGAAAVATTGEHRPAGVAVAPAGWLFPLAGFRASAVISRFGAARDGGARRHEGIDILAPRGTPVLAPRAGRVVASKKQSRGGNIVVLQGESGGTRFVFAHLDRRNVSTGDRVAAGTVLGTVGNTGNARGMSPHLHFEVDRGRGPVDPYPLLVSSDGH